MARSTGFRTKFYMKNETGEWEQIAHVRSITPPEDETDEIELEELDGDGYKEFLLGLTDPGEATVVLNFDPENQGHQKLLEAKASKEAKDFRIVLPSGTFGWEFKAFVRGFAVQEIAASEVIQAQVTLRITGSSQPGPINQS